MPRNVAARRRNARTGDQFHEVVIVRPAELEVQESALVWPHQSPLHQVMEQFVDGLRGARCVQLLSQERGEREICYCITAVVFTVAIAPPGVSGKQA